MAGRPNTPEGEPLTVSVRVTPRARRNALAFEGETLRAWVTAPPADGAANAALVTLLARRLGLPKRAITLVRGETTRDKIFAIAGISAEALRQRIESQAL